ncbi:hypothetical protein AGOR_G00205160 [Albula goreensis]|uniref:E3 ubiquitin-protein ligase n=1 Tax=Albula goreensis TaxID=1534307 RepID=A0A8T3CP45_9TELE|nr:hypothetical protein AGOR_G00205160 [Albula goreensis]
MRLTTQMASCGEVDHSVGMLPSGRKVSGDACQGSGGPSPALPVPECAICLQSCVHPVRLPCSHIFCFLCVKGASWQSKRCALCRQEIPEDFLERPTLLSPEELKAAGAGRGPGEHAWYYEGRNGWWQYDERTSRELEDAFAKGKRSTEMLIAGSSTAGAQGGAGRESSADGADTAGPQAAGPTQAPAPPVRPPTSLGGQPTSPSTPSPDASTSLENSLARLQISHPAGRSRSRNGEGEEEEDGDATPSRGSSAPNTSVDESESGGSSLEEEDEEEDEEEEDEEVEDEEEEAQAEGTQVRQRLPRRDGRADRSPPGGKSSSGSGSSSSSVRSRRPDGQCTVTEV